MPPSTSPLADPVATRELAVRIGRAWRELRRGASTARLRDFLYTVDGDHVEQGQVDTLDVLARRPTWRMSDLADELRVEPSTATRAVQRLERDGLARRRPSVDDGRVVEVEITDAGLAVHRTVSARRVELMTHIMGSFSADELDELADLLERFVGAVDDFASAHTTDR